MKTKLQRAQTLADAVREIRRLLVSPDSDLNIGDAISECDKALKAYDYAAPEQGPEPALSDALEHHIVFKELRESAAEDHWQAVERTGMAYELHPKAVAKRGFIDGWLAALWALKNSRAAQPPQPEAKPGDWMRAAAEDIIRLTTDHPPQTRAEFVALKHTGAAIIAELSTKSAGDWITPELRIEIARALFGNPETRILELPESVQKADLDGADRIIAIIAKHAPHCPNAAGDAREVSAKELIEYAKTKSKLFTGWAPFPAEMDAILGFYEAERAKASQTPSKEKP